MIKVVVALQHKEIPPHLHYKTPNPYIPWGELPVKVVTELTPWVAANGKRIAGISSFGFSGTNAHAILEEAPLLNPAVEEPERPFHVLALSSKNEAALKSLSSQFAEFLATASICFCSGLLFHRERGESSLLHTVLRSLPSLWSSFGKNWRLAAEGEVPPEF